MLERPDIGPLVIVEGSDRALRADVMDRLCSWGFRRGGATDPEGALPLSARMYYLREVNRSYGRTVLDGLYTSGQVNSLGHDDGMDSFDRWLLTGVLRSVDTVEVVCGLPEVIPHDDEGLFPLPRVYAASDDLRAAMGKISAWSLGWEGLRRAFGDVPVLGNQRNPRVILVGEQPLLRQRLMKRARQKGYSARKRDRYLRTAARLVRRAEVFDSSSGRYLYEALRRSGMRDYAIVNSVQLDGRRFRDFARHNVVASLDARWVALGNAASRELSDFGLPHEVVPHPQFWRRFHYHAMNDYVAMLRGGASA